LNGMTNMDELAVRFEEFDQTAQVVRVFTQVKRPGHRSTFHRANVAAFGQMMARTELAEVRKLMATDYDDHLLRRKKPQPNPKPRQ
jgi:hypothetical protein